MNITTESVNYFAMLLPLSCASLAVLFPGNTPQRRLISVVVPALGGILAVGFGLQGLTRACFDTAISCPDGLPPISQLGNTFGDQLNCSICREGVSPFAQKLNEFRPFAVIGCAVLGCQLSALSLIMFVKWMRRTDRATAAH